MLSCWVLLFAVVTVVSGSRPSSLPLNIFGRPQGGFLKNPFRKQLERPYDSSGIILGNVTQKLDNFNANNQDTWLQRYQYNPKFYKGEGLIFLMIGGESPISMRWISDDTYTYLTWAKKYGAAAFQVEHRFYGASHPKPDMSTASYQYFTIDQALADLRVFILDMNKKYFANVPKPRWMLFGGSYPGSLSAWLREQNPDITIGAISSSCAVNTVTDYWGYIDNMGRIYADVSATCRDNIQAAFKEINEKIYSPAGREELETTFKLCHPFPDVVTPRDIQFFLSNIIGIFQGINQYTGDNRDPPHQEGLGVPKACEKMNDMTVASVVQRVQNVVNFYNSFYVTDLPNYCTPNNYTAYMNDMKNITYDPPDYERASSRGWVWQTCTELGYFQTTDGGWSMFGSAIPMDFFVDQCKQMFGDKYDADFTRIGTANTRKKGGPDHYKGTKVVFPNGSYDPWRGLGYTKNQTGEVWAYQIQGTAHCADMYPANATTDKQSLKDARIFIGAQLDNYIRQSLLPPSTTVGPTTTSSASTLSSVAALFISAFYLIARH